MENFCQKLALIYQKFWKFHSKILKNFRWICWVIYSFAFIYHFRLYVGMNYRLNNINPCLTNLDRPWCPGKSIGNYRSRSPLSKVSKRFDEGKYTLSYSEGLGGHKLSLVQLTNSTLPTSSKGNNLLNPVMNLNTVIPNISLRGCLEES